MKHNDFRHLASIFYPNLSFRWHRLMRLSPIFISLSLAYFWLLSIPALVQSSEGTNPGWSKVEVALVESAPHAFANDPVAAPIGLNPIAVWYSSDRSSTLSAAWGDVDGDGDLDLAVADFLSSNKVYLNEGGILQPTAAWISDDSDRTYSIAWGDVDGDGDLDLAAGNWFNNKVYLNEAGTLQTVAAWISGDSDRTTSVAWGDVDGDGDLDLAAGNWGSPSGVYLNEEGTLQPTVIQLSDGKDVTQSIAWADMDGDGDLDLAVGNWGSSNKVYVNQGGMLQPIAAWVSDDNDQTESIVWGDVDGDGDLDLAAGNHGAANKVYLNEAGMLQSIAAWTSNDDDPTTSVSWGDVDGDGDLDLAAGNWLSPNKVYLNEAGMLQPTATWLSNDNDTTNSIAWGDMDGDGDLDLAAGNDSHSNKVYVNEALMLQSSAAWTSTDGDSTHSIAWGDVDGDGDLDLAAGNDGSANKVYLNDAGMLQPSVTWSSNDNDPTMSVAWGDVDGDGDLDLAAGNDGSSNGLYLNEAGTLQSTVAWLSADDDRTTTIAWGDMDGDGDLDLAAGNWQSRNKVYLNEGSMLQPAAWISDDSDQTESVVWGDVDGDGDLDLATGNTPLWDTNCGCYIGGANKVYLNELGMLQSTASWASNDGDDTESIAWGDVDGDGDLDLAAANNGSPNKVYLNESGMLQPTAVWISNDSDYSKSVTWGDVDGDSDLDLAVGNYGTPNKVYLNEAGALQSIAAWVSGDNDYTLSLAWGDVDSDGDPDLTAGNAGSNRIYLARSGGATRFQLEVNRPTPTQGADFYSTPVILDEPRIPITYTLFSSSGAFMGRVEAFYAIDGVGHWQPALGPTNTVTTALATVYSYLDSVTSTVPGFNGTEDAQSNQVGHFHSGTSHVYTWDTFASGFFGQSDNVVLRLVVYPQPVHTDIAGTYRYTNTIPGPYLWPYAAATTFPFRVRGTQVQVYSDTVAIGNEAANALVYRLPAGQLTGAQPMANNGGRPFRTDANGYLQGRGQLGIGDQLIALLPVTSTESHTLYHTSAAPTEIGLSFFTVEDPGVQTLTVSAANPLLLFDLDVSLEWDARTDTTFLNQLENDIRRASQILYDLTNGQVALGDVRVYHARERWHEAHVAIQASNSQRPSAVLGGIVITPTNDIGITGVITNAFLPGQVRIGPTWNRFGEPDGTLGEDWPRTLAHELGHYLLFMPDNYLGLTPDRQLTLVDCQGSAMTDPYSDAYSEFLTRDEWSGDCLNTFAALYLDRADWETITTFYPMLSGTGVNSGPSNLPLAVTQVEFIAPETEPATLAAPFFSLVNSSGSPAPIPGSQGQGYLLKTSGNNDPAGDTMIALGSPVGDLIQARGAEPGDRLCVFDYGHDPLRLGCKTVGSTASSLTLDEIPDWSPQITVTPVNTQTFAITVTEVTETNLNVQLLPGTGTASEALPMNPAGTAFIQTVTLANGAFYGFVRVWVPDSVPLKEMIVDFIAIGEWDARALAWGGRALAWGGRALAWGAPILSSDGQVSIFALDDPFGDDSNYTLQVLPLPPSLPTWLTPVGRAYRVSADEPLANRAILFRYLGRDVPAGQENGLRVYYSPDDGQTWERLDTELDTHQNHASASMQGEGIYVLIATIEMPVLVEGWNNFGYPVQTARPVTEALASIDGYYTSIYHYDPLATNAWQLYDDTVEARFTDFVNTLDQLEFGHAYWIYVTDTVTLYLGVDSPAALQQFSLLNTVPFPPATFYGWVEPSADFTPAPGMPVTAEINGVVCGQTTLESLDGQLAYNIQVRAEPLVGNASGCGAEGRNIVFKVGDWVMDNNRLWNNSQAWFHPLDDPTEESTTSISHQTYLPLAVRSSLSTSWASTTARVGSSDKNSFIMGGERQRSVR